MTTPYTLAPLCKPTLWAGTSLAALKGLPQGTRVGESWEVSGVPDCQSTVQAGGIDPQHDQGLTLSQLIDKHKESLLGHEAYARYGNRFPLLAKFIDAQADLSLQVHPGDTLARLRHDSPGKEEMWYIMQARPGARILAGMKASHTPDSFEALVRSLRPGDEQRLEEAVSAQPSRKGDAYHIPAGRIHAIGAGNLLAEIQQASDVTYRVYDYCRLDSNGQPRPLHIALARDAIDYTVTGDCRLAYDRTSADALLLVCPSFTVRRLVVDGEANAVPHPDCFAIVMCLEGEATVNGSCLTAGHSLLVPACTSSLRLSGRASLLTATL